MDESAKNFESSEIFGVDDDFSMRTSHTSCSWKSPFLNDRHRALLCLLRPFLPPSMAAEERNGDESMESGAFGGGFRENL